MPFKEQKSNCENNMLSTCMSCKMIKHVLTRSLQFLHNYLFIFLWSGSFAVQHEDHFQSRIIWFLGVQFGDHLWSWDHLPTCTIQLGGERHCESKVICPRTLHIDLGQGLNIDCSFQSPVHQPLDCCTFHWNTSM